MIEDVRKEKENMESWQEEAARSINDDCVALKYMLPEGLRELVVDVDDRAWESFLEPRKVSIQVETRWGRAKLRWIELICGNEEVWGEIRVTKTFEGMVLA